MRFIRENPTLAFGLGLPLLMVAFFALAAKLQNLEAVPPRYGIVYATNYYNGGSALRFEVRDKKAHLSYHGTRVYRSVEPEFYLYDPATNTTHPLSYSLPKEVTESSSPDPDGKAPKKTFPVAAPEIEALTLDPSPTAPDGYSFSTEDYASRGVFDFLIGYRNERQTTLRKGSYRVRIPQTPLYNAPTFVGWVIAQ